MSLHGRSNPRTLRWITPVIIMMLLVSIMMFVFVTTVVMLVVAIMMFVFITTVVMLVVAIMMLLVAIMTTVMTATTVVMLVVAMTTTMIPVLACPQRSPVLIHIQWPLNEVFFYLLIRFSKR